MSHPPKTPPHSEIDGVDRDQRPNVEAAVDAGQDGEDLELARKEGKGRPAESDKRKGRDDRSG